MHTRWEEKWVEEGLRLMVGVDKVKLWGWGKTMLTKCFFFFLARPVQNLSTSIRWKLIWRKLAWANSTPPLGVKLIGPSFTESVSTREAVRYFRRRFPTKDPTFSSGKRASSTIKCWSQLFICLHSNARHFTGGHQVLDIYDSQLGMLRIGPFNYDPVRGVDLWLSQSDDFILQHLSTSPGVEPPHFVMQIRATLKYIQDNQFPGETWFLRVLLANDYQFSSTAITVFRENRPLYYRRDENTGLWQHVRY